MGGSGPLVQGHDCNFDISTGNRVSIECGRVRTTVMAQSLEFVGSVLEVSERKEMTFTRHGDTYFLSTIWIKDEGRQLAKSDAEKALAESGLEGTAVKLKVK